MIILKLNELWRFASALSTVCCVAALRAATQQKSWVCFIHLHTAMSELISVSFFNICLMEDIKRINLNNTASLWMYPFQSYDHSHAERSDDSETDCSC
jgi:hypothetical protein